MSGGGWGPPGPPGPGHGPPPGYGYGPPPGWGAPLPQPAPGAVAALVLGVVALVGGMTCLLPILVAPVAWVLGHRAVRQIDRAEVTYTGRGMAMAGWVLGVVGTVLLVLGLVAAVVLVVLASNGTFDPAPEPAPAFDPSPDLGARLLGR